VPGSEYMIQEYGEGLSGMFLPIETGQSNFVHLPSQKVCFG